MYSVSDLDKEIDEILIKGNEYIFPEITAVLHTPDSDLPIELLSHLDIDSNFNNEIIDNISIDFMYPMGDYRDVILKYRNTLEVTITIDYTVDNPDRKYTDTGIYNNQSILLKEQSKGDKPIINRYRFIPLIEDKRFKSSIYTKISTEDLNKLDMIVVKGQCIDPIILGLKQFIISGIYQQYTVEQVIKGLLQTYLDKLAIANEKFSYKFNFIKPDNETIYDHIVIKSNTKLIQLPFILQSTDYGVYNGDINLYISKDLDNNYIINIYPLYDNTRFDTTPNNRLLIYSGSKPSTALNEITYYKDNKATNDIKIVVSDVTTKSTGLNDTISIGDGLFNVNPNLVLDESLKAFSKTHMYFNTDKLLNKEINDNNTTNISKFINTNQDDNLYKYRAAVLRTFSNLASINISKPDIRIFIPGMYLNYIYTHDDSVITKKGMVQNVSTTFNIAKKTSVAILNFTMEK